MSKNYELIRENGKIVDVKVDGKPVKRSFIRGLKKAQNTSYWKEYKTEGVAENPFSGIQIKLNPLEWSILTWCQAWYYGDYDVNMYTGNFQAPIQAYDEMKYFLLSLNSKAYYELLD